MQGASFTFSSTGGTLIAPNGVNFAMKCVNNLYYLNTLAENKEVLTSTLMTRCPERIFGNVEDSITECYNFKENEDYVNTSKSGTHSVETWHRIMGHCNIKDFFIFKRLSMVCISRIKMFLIVKPVSKEKCLKT